MNMLQLLSGGVSSQSLVLARLEKLKYGSLDLRLPDGSLHSFRGEMVGPNADITIRDAEMFTRVLHEGDIGFGESYIEGHWDSDDIAALLKLLAMNVETLGGIFTGNLMHRFLFNCFAVRHRNTKQGSKRNIFSHYDLGNQFYQLWLDETMSYSSAIYGEQAKPLERAQTDKYQRILDELGDPGHVLEIGCGWGGFCDRAASNGFNVTGLTISDAQAEYATRRMANAGHGNSTEIAVRDYRDERGLYDHIVSIEMFEAVGEHYWPQFFKTVKDRLSHLGTAMVQTITIDDAVFDAYRKRGDFIRRHIFPGGMLPSKERFTEEACHAGLEVTDTFAFGKDYDRTLGEWLQRFDDRVKDIRALGYRDEFIRKWRFYMAYCMSGFATGRTDVVQFKMSHAHA